MRSLFLKMLLLYWLASVVVFTATYAVFRWTRGSTGPQPVFATMDRALAEEAVERYESAGAEGLAAHVQKLKGTSSFDLYVLDAAGAEVTGRTLPPVDGQRFGPRRIPVTAGDGRTFAVLVIPPRPPLWRQTLSFGLLALAIGAVSYGLARHVAAPIKELRAASQQLGRGTLGARVGPKVARRRDALGDLARDFDLMADRLQALVDSHQRLLRDVSHELRSPLARLQVALGLAEQRAGAGAAEALAEIECEAARLNELIERLLMVSRLDATAGGHERLVVDVAELVRRVAADADYEAQGRGCHMHFVACEACAIAGEPELLHSAVENVVRNALRYTADGTEVDLAVRRANGEVVILVRDRGPGVPADQLERIFQPFYRLADARERESGGAGLGLAIAERAVHVHGGSIGARNAPGGGLLVEIRLPATTGAAPAASVQNSG